MISEVKQHYAFISYNHQDIKYAKWLHKKLEHYKLPTGIHNEFVESKYLRPIFRDKEDLDSGILSDELEKHLKNSKYLIVICSPHSAQSKWVSNEVKAFIDWGRLEYVIPFIIDGIPNVGNACECFPLSLKEYVSEHADRELLGINIKEVGREKAFVRVVSRMLGVSFDELWKRHQREERKRLITLSLGIPFIALLFGYFSIPVTLKVDVHDSCHKLPMPENALLVVNGAEYSLNKLDTCIKVKHIPGYYRGRKIPLSFSAVYYESINEEKVKIGFGLNQLVALNLNRDSTFSIYSGFVVDEDDLPIKDAVVQIGEKIIRTDESGFFCIKFSLEEQTENKPIRIIKIGKKEIFREDECPSEDLRYLMYK